MLRNYWLKDFEIPYMPLDTDKSLKVASALNSFFEIASKDYIITMSHICVYTSLLHLWSLNQFRHPFRITRKKIMHLAKIHAKTTYHKCIKELQDSGYILYSPSFRPHGETQVFMLSFTEKTWKK